MQSQTPPIAASPARVGAAVNTASSPPLPTNPNPKPAQATTTTSGALLSLLPPLPRAQTLLHHLSSLSSALFSVSPHRALWLASFRGSLPTFLTSAPTPAPAPAPFPDPPSTTKDLLALFDSLQSQLLHAVADLQTILDLKDTRLKLTRDLRSNHSTLLAFARKLNDAEQLLDRLVDDYSHYRAPPKRSKPNTDTAFSSALLSSLDLEEILSCAHRVSYTTFAPPEHGAGLAPLRGALPPAPQDNEMRASQLYHFADLDVGVPVTLAAESNKLQPDAPAAALMEPTPPREELPPPPLLPIALPPGWKGLPIELPPVPPGWKPGDPVPLPPFDAVMAGNKGADQAPVLGSVPRAQTREQEPIQVAPVQLDININDASSSDYSSEVGSSDEDDED